MLCSVYCSIFLQDYHKYVPMEIASFLETKDKTKKINRNVISKGNFEGLQHYHLLGFTFR